MGTERGCIPEGQTARSLLDLYYLEIRSHLVEAAAGLDRISRGANAAEALADPRMAHLLQALDVMASDGKDRTEHILNLLSVPARSGREGEA